MEQILCALITIIAALVGCALYLGLSNSLLDRLICLLSHSYPARYADCANMARPWLFLLPVLLLLILYLLYPVFETLRLSFMQRLPEGGYEWVGGDNYHAMLQEPKFHEAFYNNVAWLVVVPAVSTLLGLMAAELSGRLSWGYIAKVFIFMPMAISFVGAAVIWKMVYDTRPAGHDQVGLLNALYLSFGGKTPRIWLLQPFWNNFLLMAILIWIQTGFAMVILSVALRNIPRNIIEAAVIDGAGPLRIFFQIKVPQITQTIMVVWTAVTVVVLKVFDVVFVMTNGQWGTQVLANYMYDKLFRAHDWGLGSAAAVVIMLMVMPVLVWNIFQNRKERQ